MAWPVVVAAGGPRERGRAYGTQAADRVQGSIAVYEGVFGHYAQLPWREVTRRAEPFVEAIDAYDPQLLPELEGIAEGAGVDAEDVLAVNLRTEVMFGLDARPAQAAAKAARECTAIARRFDDGRVVVAQNWDWKPAVRDTCVILVCAPHDRPGFVSFVEAGLWAKCGANEAGIALATNALQSSLDAGRPGVPYHAVLRRVLTSATWEEAVDAVRRGPRSSSANYLLGHRDGRTIDIEAAPGASDEVYELEGLSLVHTNHFLWPSPRPFEDLGLIDGQDSLHRHACAAGLAPGASTVRDVRDALARHDDPEGSVCAHGDPDLDPVEDYVTVGAIVADLASDTLSVADGNPCVATWQEHRIGDDVASARRTDGS